MTPIKTIILLVLLALAGNGLKAQTEVPAEKEPPWFKPRMKLITADSIYASHIDVYVREIILEGNRLTRDRIIHRELLFQPGDSLPANKFSRHLEAGRLNLMNTSLFNFVETTVDHTEFPELVITYTFVERWNIWPVPVFELNEPNLNQWLEDPSLSKFNYGIRAVATNLTGRNERIQLQAKMGNVQSFHLLLYTPYINRNQTIGLGFRYGMNRTRERAYATINNERQFLELDESYVSNEYFAAVHTNIRPKLYNNHRIALGYHSYQYSDTLLTLNPRFGPGGKSEFSFFSGSYEFSRDRRDIVAYPLDGYYFKVGIQRKGFGLLSNENMDVTSLEGEVQHYFGLAPRWFTAWSAKAKWSEGSTLSYFDQEGLGYLHSLVRGYESYIIDGHRYLVLKSNLKYELIPQRVIQLGFISSEKFSLIHYALYANIFVDAGFLKDKLFSENNPLSNKWLGGAGLGVDLVTYYDNVLRTEFTMNRHGNAGIFFHMVAPI